LHFQGEVDRISETENNLASFEIRASYLDSNMPDILDKYQLKNSSFGILVNNNGGSGKQREMIMKWSPMMMQEP
jgi:hypothetical protein